MHLKQRHHNQNTTNRKPKGQFLSQIIGNKSIFKTQGLNVKLYWIVVSQDTWSCLFESLPVASKELNKETLSITFISEQYMETDVYKVPVPSFYRIKTNQSTECTADRLCLSVSWKTGPKWELKTVFI